MDTALQAPIPWKPFQSPDCEKWCLAPEMQRLGRHFSDAPGLFLVNKRGFCSPNIKIYILEIGTIIMIHLVLSLQYIKLLQ